MAFAWHISALPGLVSGIVSLLLAFLVFTTRADRGQNRFLALFLATTGLGWFAHKGLTPLSDDPAFAFAAANAFLAFHWAAHTFHLLFVTTLDTAVVRPLANTVARSIIGAVGAVAVSSVFWLDYTSGVTESAIWPGWWGTVGPNYVAVAPLFILLFLYGVAAAIGAFVQSRDERAKRQNRAYLIAFLIHDGGMALMLILVGALGVISNPAIVQHLFHWVPSFVNIWMVCWLAYGILKTQLFDIDLRLRWTVSRSTLAAPAAAVFFLVGEGVEGGLPIDGYMAGLLAAALIAGLLWPLRRLADRFAAALVPEVDAESSKQDVYRNAYDGFRGGGISERERRILDNLARDLGLQPGAVRRLEDP